MLTLNEGLTNGLVVQARLSPNTTTEIIILINNSYKESKKKKVQMNIVNNNYFYRLNDSKGRLFSRFGFYQCQNK